MTLKRAWLRDAVRGFRFYSYRRKEDGLWVVFDREAWREAFRSGMARKPREWAAAILADNDESPAWLKVGPTSLALGSPFRDSFVKAIDEDARTVTLDDDSVYRADSENGPLELRQVTLRLVGLEDER